MRPRDAHSSIKGYIYQFNYAIKEILQSSLNSEVTIEGIEDLDINTDIGLTAIQCKYYEGTEYNHSKISEALRYMLIDYHKRIADGLPIINYRLYGYYKSGHEKLCLPIDINFLKTSFLTYTHKEIKHYLHEELDLSDSQLAEFLEKLIINNNAEEFNILFESIIDLLKGIKNCTAFEAENYYYNNALNVIKDLAINPLIDKRKITKPDFLSKIDNKEILFNQWLLQLKGENAFIASIKKQYFSQLNVSRKDRFFIIDVNSASTKLDLMDLVRDISRKYSKLSKREATPFCPYVFLNIDYNMLYDIKKKLYEFGFYFLDGYPYHESRFEINAIHAEANYTNKIKVRIIENIAFLEETISSSPYQKEVYQFYANRPIFNFENDYIRHIKIQTNNISQIMRII